MSKLVDIVLQGPMYDYTPNIAKEYSELPFVNNVIISCWDSCPSYKVDANIIVVRSSDVAIPGFGNRNRQIKSSMAGMEHVVTEFSAKMRTDQYVSKNSMLKLYEHYFSNCEYSGTAGPYNKIGVHGICRDFAFHPIDHIFWGNTQDLLQFFDIEYEYKSPPPIDISQFNYYIRSETYLTLPYVIHHHPELDYIQLNSDDYLLDNSSKKPDALTISENIMKSLFCVFPKIELNWIKYGMPSYHYDVMESSLGGHAYWADSV